MLTKDGWIATIVIGIVFIFCRIDSFIVFPILFLLLGSLVSRLNPSSEDASGRKASQVIANAGVSALVAIGYFYTKDKLFLDLFALCYGIALADTFSSEIGRRFGNTPIDILTFKKIDKGLSGGISLYGTLGGLLGALIVATVYYFLTNQEVFDLGLVGLAFTGMIIDSIIGSSIQAKYKSAGTIQESGLDSELISGFRIINNDAVNFIAILLTVLLGYFTIYN